MNLALSLGCERIDDQAPLTILEGLIREREQLGKWALRRRVEVIDFDTILDIDSIVDFDNTPITICLGRGNTEKRGLRTNFDGLRGLGNWDTLSQQQIILRVPRQDVRPGEVAQRIYTRTMMQGDTVMVLKRTCDNPRFTCYFVFGRIAGTNCLQNQ